MSIYQRYIVVLAGMCSWVLGPVVGYGQDSLHAAAFTRFIEGFMPRVDLPYHVDALGFFNEGIDWPQIDSVSANRFLPIDSLRRDVHDLHNVYFGPLAWQSQRILSVIWYADYYPGSASDVEIYYAYLTTFTLTGQPIGTFRLGMNREGFKSGEHESSNLVWMEEFGAWGIVTSGFQTGWDAEKWAWDDDPYRSASLAIVNPRGKIGVVWEHEDP